MTIGFAGLSHLGIVSSICAASRGFNLLGYDSDHMLVEKLSKQELPIFEQDLADFLAKAKKNISFTGIISDLKKCDLIYISMDVQTDQNNASNLAPLTKLISEVVAVAKDNTCVVVLSQVPPGYTRNLGLSLDLTKIKLFYQVETLIFGRAVERALHPERYIIGCSGTQSVNDFPEAFSELLRSANCPILPMLYESAELCKISINMFLAASVTVTNTLAEICEGVGADWSEIAPALKLDKRIGPHAYLAPGMGLSGGNIERDIATIIDLAHEFGTEASIAHAFFSNSFHRKEWALKVLHKKIFSKKANARICVLGIAYKQDTKSVKNSPSVDLLESIKEFTVSTYDPQAKLPTAFNNYRVSQFDSSLEAVNGADAIVLMTPWNAFRTLNLKDIKKNMAGNLIIDPFNLLDPKLCEVLDFEYVTLGRN